MVNELLTDPSSLGIADYAINIRAIFGDIGSHICQQAYPIKGVD